jgi:hypothetical protein
MINREVERAELNSKIVKQIKDLSKNVNGMAKSCIDAALAIYAIFQKPVIGTKNNPIKFSKMYKRK